MSNLPLDEAARSPDAPVRVAFYDGPANNVPAPVDLTWPEVVEVLTSFDEPACALEPGGALPVCAGKKCPAKMGKAWSPVDIEGTRANENVRAITLAVFDLDHLEREQLDEVRASVAEYAHVVHSTHGHAPDDECYRLVMPLSRPVKPDEWPRVRRALVKALSLPADPSCGDLARLYFLPTRRGGVDPVAIVGEGEPVGVDEALEVARMLAAESAPNASAPVPVPVPVASPESFDLGALRARLAEVRRSKARGDERAREQAELLGRVLDGAAIAEVGARHKARRAIAGLLAYWLPASTPWEVVVELLRPSLSATPREPGDEDPFEKTRKMYEDSMRSRLAADEKRAAERAALNEIVKAVKARGAPSAGEVAAAGVEDWRDLLIQGPGGPKACEFNVDLILGCDPEVRGTIRWNEVTKKIEIDGGPFAGLSGEALAGTVAGWVQRQHGCMAGAALVGGALLRAALKNPRDPLAEYLGELAWDGVPRMDTFLEQYFSADVSTPERLKYVRAVSRRWLISLVARALAPGCKVDNVVVLQGPQGGGKTSALKALVGARYFLDTSIDISDKDAKQAIASQWLVELGELASFRRAENNKTKQFFSTQTDKYRPPYGAAMLDSPRRCVFVGTTNDDEYLTDRTGNRRYWPVLVGDVDVAGIARDRDQLLAEAVRAYASGERWWFHKVLDADLIRIANGETEERLVSSSTEEAIARWWYAMRPEQRPTRVTTLEVGEMALKLTPDQLELRGMQIRIGSAMKRLGFVRAREQSNRQRGRYYEPSAEMREASAAPPARRFTLLSGGRKPGREDA